jgi:hypothetical protein
MANCKCWDCHKHRDELRVSFANTVFHPERGQLCYIEEPSGGFVTLYHPIRFKDAAAARQWIESGCIADLQEEFTLLGIGFSTACMIGR